MRRPVSAALLAAVAAACTIGAACASFGTTAPGPADAGAEPNDGGADGAVDGGLGVDEAGCAVVIGATNWLEATNWEMKLGSPKLTADGISLTEGHGEDVLMWWKTPIDLKARVVVNAVLTTTLEVASDAGDGVALAWADVDGGSGPGGVAQSLELCNATPPVLALALAVDTQDGVGRIADTSALSGGCITNGPTPIAGLGAGGMFPLGLILEPKGATATILGMPIVPLGALANAPPATRGRFGLSASTFNGATHQRIASLVVGVCPN